MNNYIRHRLAIDSSKMVRTTPNTIHNIPYNEDPNLLITGHNVGNVLTQHPNSLDPIYNVINFHVKHHIPFGILKNIANHEVTQWKPSIQTGPHVEDFLDHESNLPITNIFTRALHDITPTLGEYMPDIMSHWLSQQIVNTARQADTKGLTRYFHPMLDRYKEKFGEDKYLPHLAIDLTNHHYQNYINFLLRKYPDLSTLQGYRQYHTRQDYEPEHTLIQHYHELAQDDPLTHGILHYVKHINQEG
jgi:hypothetical protein